MSKSSPASKFTPEFKGPIEGWVVNQLERHYWRVQATMTRMDVMQEAYIKFHHLKMKYFIAYCPMLMQMMSMQQNFVDTPNQHFAERSRLMRCLSECC